MEWLTVFAEGMRGGLVLAGVARQGGYPGKANAREPTASTREETPGANTYIYLLLGSLHCNNLVDAYWQENGGLFKTKVSTGLPLALTGKQICVKIDTFE